MVESREQKIHVLLLFQQS